MVVWSILLWECCDFFDEQALIFLRDFSRASKVSKRSLLHMFLEVSEYFSSDYLSFHLNRVFIANIMWVSGNKSPNDSFSIRGEGMKEV